VDLERAKRLKVRPLPPVGQKFLTIDLCRIHESKSHLAAMWRRLNVVLPLCTTLELLPATKEMRCILDMTASNGHETVAFVRRIAFRADELMLLSRYGIELMIDAVPCGGPG
jgi:hypothetical protein